MDLVPISSRGTSRRPRAFARLFAAVSLAAISGCGGSEESTLPPPVDNPFLAFVAGTDSTFDVVTWNLHGFAAAGSATVELVADAVVALDVDVIAIQEVASPADFSSLAQALPGWGAALGPSAPGYQLAYLWRQDSVSPVAGGIYEIYTDADGPFPRPPLILDLTWRGRSIIVVNNHFKCCGDGRLQDSSHDEERRRLDACELLDEWIVAQAPDRAVVVLGDLNDKLDDPPADNVFQPFLDQPALYRFADMAMALGPAGGWSWGPGASHLDHILVSDELFPGLDAPGGAAYTVRLDIALSNDDYQQLVSDHAPVVARLVLPIVE